MADDVTPRHETRPVLAVLTSHWLSVTGSALVTIAGCSWLLLLPLHARGGVSNPYLGILSFFIVPIIFFIGLILIPVGSYLARRRIRAGLASAPDRGAILRHLAWFFGVMTVVNVIIGSQVSYRAAEQMETLSFCGQSCHVMRPQFLANQRSAHRATGCVACHVLPGATGFIEAKMNGTRQLIEVLTDSYPRPVPPGLSSGRLASSAETCELCHSRAIQTGPRLRVLSKFQDDEANTSVKTVLMMNVGGGRLGGIHGTHMGPGVTIRYRATNAGRATIPWVEYANSITREKQAYLESGAKDPGGPTYVMQCADCHNRQGHSFELPEQAVDDAMAAGRISPTLPFAHKTGVQILSAEYRGDADAARKIPAAFSAFYAQKYPEIATQRRGDIDHAGKALLDLYQRNVFADLGVKWGTYPNNLGHADSPGCFRCHDESHLTTLKSGATKTITQDCNVCHQALAVEEHAPDILKSLGLL